MILQDGLLITIFIQPCVLSTVHPGTKRLLNGFPQMNFAYFGTPCKCSFKKEGENKPRDIHLKKKKILPLVDVQISFFKCICIFQLTLYLTIVDPDMKLLLSLVAMSLVDSEPFWF